MGSLYAIGALAALTGFLVYDTYYLGHREWVESEVDGKKYLVQSNHEDKQEAANLLAQIRERLVRFVAHIEKSSPSDPRTQRVVLKFQPDKIEEGKDSTKYTSFTVEKGERIIFCLRAKNANNKLVDINTMMFVALHEIAHIASVSIGHTDEFWANFKWILEEAVNIGIYAEADYERNPVQYCGLTISNSPLN